VLGASGRSAGRGSGRGEGRGGAKRKGSTKLSNAVGADARAAMKGRGLLVSLKPGTMMPYNAQATLHSYDALWGLLLPCSVSGRVTDIWRSYFTQRLLWDVGMRIAFASPWVTQFRNAHKLLGDFDAEIPLYQQAGALAEALAAWKPTSTSLPGRLEELYICMYEFGILELSDVQLAQAWIFDLLGVGYRFPPLFSRRKGGVRQAQPGKSELPPK